MWGCDRNKHWVRPSLFNATPVYNLDIMKSMQHPSSQWTILQWPSWEDLLHDEDHKNWQEDLFTHQYSQIFLKFKWKASLVPRPTLKKGERSGDIGEFSWSCAPSRVPIQNLCKESHDCWAVKLWWDDWKTTRLTKLPVEKEYKPRATSSESSSCGPSSLRFYSSQV